MANSVQHRRGLKANYHELLCENLLLLNLFNPFSNDLKNVMNDTMFTRPNQAAFLQVSHYLICVIDPDSLKEFCWPVYDKKMEATYRRQFSVFIARIVSAEEAIVSPIMPSQLVNASGYKVLKLFYELSLVALKKVAEMKLKRRQVECEHLNIVSKVKNGTVKLDFLKDLASKTNQRAIDKAKRFADFKSNAQRISKIYTDKIPIVKQKLNERRTFLNTIVDKLVATNCIKDPSLLEKVEEIKDVNKKSSFLTQWQIELDERIKLNESAASCSKLQTILNSARECKQITGLVISRYLKQNKDSYTLSYNSQKDNMSVPVCIEKELSSQQQFVLKNIITDGKLHFPNLLRAYVIVIQHVFKGLTVVESIDSYEESILRYNEGICDVRKNLKELSIEANAFRQQLIEAQQLRSNEQDDDYDYKSDFPPMPSLKFHTHTPSKDQHLTVNSYTPTTLSRIKFTVHKHGNLTDVEMLPRSKTLDSLPRSHRRTQLHRKSMACFARNMAEVKQNMLVIKKPSLDMTLSNLTLSTVRLNHSMQIRDSGKHARRQLATLLGKGTTVQKGNERRLCEQLFRESPEASISMHKSKSSPNLFIPGMPSSPRGKPTRLLLDAHNDPEVSNVNEVANSTVSEDCNSTILDLNHITPKQNSITSVPAKAARSSVEKLIARFHELTHNRMKNAPNDLTLSERSASTSHDIKCVDRQLNHMTLDFLNDINSENKENNINKVSSHVSEKQHISTIPDLLHSPNYQMSSVNLAMESSKLSNNRTPELTRLEDVDNIDNNEDIDK